MLLQSYEIGKFTGIKVLSCDFRDIFPIETHEFNTCLGVDFYNYLKNNLNNYPACSWNSGDQYNIGDIVLYKNYYYKALESNTNKEPLTCKVWELLPKFNSECLEYLWENYLAPYLSFKVIKTKLPFLSIQLTSDGLIKKTGNNFQAADNTDFITIQKAIYSQIDLTFKNLDTYIKSNATLDCVKLYKGLQVEPKCNTCKQVEESCTCGTSNAFGYEFA